MQEAFLLPCQLKGFPDLVVRVSLILQAVKNSLVIRAVVPLALDGVRRHLRPLRDTRQVRGVVLYPARIRQRPLVVIISRVTRFHCDKLLRHTQQLSIGRRRSLISRAAAAPAARRAARAACALFRQRRCKLPSCNRPVTPHRVRIQAVQLQHRPCGLVAAAACQPRRSRERTRLVCAGDGCAAVIVEDSSVQTIPAQHGVRGIARSLLVQVERLLVGIQCIALAGALFVVLPLFPGKLVLPLLLGVAL